MMRGNRSFNERDDMLLYGLVFLHTANSSYLLHYISLHFSISSRQTMRPPPPPIKWVPEALFLQMKRQRREADHSPPRSIPPFPHTSSWHSASLVKHRDNSINFVELIFITKIYFYTSVLMKEQQTHFNNLIYHMHTQYIYTYIYKYRH
jgi:hypothetical protein